MKIGGICMSKRGAGVAILFIAAFLIGMKYISAAILLSGVGIWDKSLFKEALGTVGSSLNIFIIITIVAGIAYIIWGEYEEQQKNKMP